MQRAVLPSLDHIHYTEFDHVYEPCEDSFLMCDALLNDSNTLKLINPGLTLELGPGSGVVSTYFCQLMKGILGYPPFHLGVDINPRACALSSMTAEQNNIHFYDSVNASLLNNLTQRSEDSFDVVLFNPPYVVTPDEEVSGNGLSAAWAGGTNGRLVTDKALPQIVRLLKKPLSYVETSPSGRKGKFYGTETLNAGMKDITIAVKNGSGVLYMIAIEENIPSEIASNLTSVGISSDICIRVKARNEFLMVMRFWFTCKPL